MRGTELTSRRGLLYSTLTTQMDAARNTQPHVPCHAIVRCHCSTRLPPALFPHLLSLSRRPREPFLFFARHSPFRLDVLGHRRGHIVQGSNDKHTSWRMNNSREPSSIATLPGDWVWLRGFQSPSLRGDCRPSAVGLAPGTLLVNAGNSNADCQGDPGQAEYACSWREPGTGFTPWVVSTASTRLGPSALGSVRICKPVVFVASETRCRLW